MKRILLLFIIQFSLITNLVSAELVGGIDIEFVTIGHAGNAPDTQVMTTDGTTGYGAVSNEYRIGKYEVTNSQWDLFVTLAGAPVGGLNELYDEDAYYTGAQQPTNYVSWYEAAQFCNYLTSGDKSKGVYQFTGDNSNPGIFLGIDRAAAKSTYRMIYFLPTEDEWYKAAYYEPDGSGYSLYANGFYTVPTADDGWNYSGGAYSIPWNVGTGAEEQNGTFDMMGNVWEWNETSFDTLYNGLPCRGLRGGSYTGFDYDLASSHRIYDFLPYDYRHVGFRVASIPEPCTVLLLGLGGVLIRTKTGKGITP